MQKCSPCGLFDVEVVEQGHSPVLVPPYPVLSEPLQKNPNARASFCVLDRGMFCIHC